MLAAPVAPWQLNSCLFLSIRPKIRLLSDFGLRISDFALCLCPARLFPLSRFFAFRFSPRIRVCSCPFVVQFHRFLFAWFAVENSCCFAPVRAIRVKVPFPSDFGLRISDFAIGLCPARLFPLSRFFAFRFSPRIRVCSCPFVVQFHRFLFAWFAWLAVDADKMVKRPPCP
jgi:hypothetical protein